MRFWYCTTSWGSCATHILFLDHDSCISDVLQTSFLAQWWESDISRAWVCALELPQLAGPLQLYWFLKTPTSARSWQEVYPKPESGHHTKTITMDRGSCKVGVKFTNSMCTFKAFENNNCHNNQNFPNRYLNWNLLKIKFTKNSNYLKLEMQNLNFLNQNWKLLLKILKCKISVQFFTAIWNTIMFHRAQLIAMDTYITP